MATIKDVAREAAGICGNGFTRHQQIPESQPSLD